MTTLQSKVSSFLQVKDLPGKMNDFVKIKMEDMKVAERIQLGEKCVVLEKNVFRSEDLIKRNNPLWGWYPVKSLIVNEKEIDVSDEYFYCGDCFQGECFIKKIN